MPEYKDTATRLREASKRNDLPTGIVALLSEAYAEIEQLQRERDDARWEVCELSSNGSIDDATRISVERGWDYFHNSNNQENDNGEE